MNLDTLPLLPGFRAAFLAGPDEGAVMACTDYLIEQGAELADVLRLYAGSPPDWLAETWHEDEGLRAVLALWCELTEPGVREPQPKSWPFKELRFRWEVVRACEADFRGELDRNVEYHAAPLSIQMQVTSETLRAVCAAQGKGYSPAMLRAVQQARRDQKRRVLALFPDVKHRRLLRFPLPDSHAEMRRIIDQAEAWLREGGWRVDVGITATQDDTVKKIRYEQTLAAPDWIPPEPAPRRGPFAATPADLREGRENRRHDLDTEVHREAERRGIDFDGAPLRQVSDSLFGTEGRRRGLVTCSHIEPGESLFYLLPVVNTEGVVLESFDLIPRASRPAERVRFWFGQCRRCRTVYWGRRDVRAEGPERIEMLAGLPPSGER